jgi:hypothetical protein
MLRAPPAASRGEDSLRLEVTLQTFQQFPEALRFLGEVSRTLRSHLNHRKRPATSSEAGWTSHALRINVRTGCPAAMERQHQCLTMLRVRRVNQIKVGGISLLDLAARRRSVEPITEGWPSKLPAQQDDRRRECEFQSFN